MGCFYVKNYKMCTGPTGRFENLKRGSETLSTFTCKEGIYIEVLKALQKWLFNSGVREWT